MTKLLAGRKALVTGASSGIGKGIAKVLAREGADVVFTYRNNKAGADQTLEELETYGTKIFSIQADIAQISDIDSMFKAAVKNIGGLDIVVNNAGITNKYMFLDITEDEYDELFNINCRGTFFATQRAARYMKAHDGGSIVNISSLSSRASTEGFSAYASTKAAMNKFTETAAIELGLDKVRINSIAAGWVPVGEELNKPEDVKKKQLYHIPVGRFGLPADIGEMCAFLASNRAEFITGQTFFVDGGQSTMLSIPSKSRKEKY